MTQLDARAREVEHARLWRVSAPLLVAGTVGSVLNVGIGIAFAAPWFFLGEFLCGAGAYATSRATRSRLRSMNGNEPDTLRHFAWLLAGLLLTLSGFVLPICLT